MKKLLITAAVAGLVGTANAQSAFEGFYGQIATGYESNSISNLGNNYSYITGGGATGTGSNNSSNQTANGVPLVIGLGYNFAIDSKWLIGVGADYSALTQESGTYRSVDADGSVNGPSKLKVSNRYNIFVSPGYAIDKQSMVYAKAGYSAQTLKYSGDAYSTTPALISTNDMNGYILGLGYKQIISGGLYAFAEGNYMSYSKTSVNLAWTETNGVRVNSTGNPAASAYTLLVGVGYRF